MSTSRSAGSVQYDNTDRVAIVTGGCSGIGLGICKRFLESEAKVICADIDQTAAKSLPDGIAFRKCNTAIEQDCIETIRYAVDQFGGLDVLINNAAIQPTDSYHRINELPTEVFERMVKINLGGYHLMAKHALAQMRMQRSGVVCNIASGQAHRTARQVGVYGPIKAANVMQSRQWAVEYARDGIRVVSVSPGAIDTPLVRASLAAQGGSKALANRHPLGRIGHTDEVANAVLWLCSADASFVTGTDLEVDGGLGAFGAFADPYPNDG
ncbi:MAG: SDR family oxidoreductase [Pirellulaceae bacterium]|nr:SDR family oxidoreductase [Pirellulaceae bacterium]